MSIRLKLLIIVLFVALVPLGISAYTSLGIHQRALERNLTTLHQAAASQQAQRLDSRLGNLEENLKRLVNSTLPWSELSGDELQAALWLIYRADDDIVAVTLLDSENALVGTPAYLVSTNASEEPLHLPVTSQVVTRLQEQLRQLHMGSTELGVGPAFSVSDHPSAIVPLRLAIPGREPGSNALNLAVGLSLRSVCRLGSQPSELEFLLVDAAGRSLCGGSIFGRLEPVAGPMMQRRADGGTIQTYRDRRGRELLSTAVPLRYGWQVLAEQPVSMAFATSQDLRLRAWIWLLLSAAVALCSGLLLARSISLPVRKLMKGVDELTRGNLQHRLVVDGDDEFARLGGALNRLASELAEREADIRGWNAELQQKVEERTRAIARYHANLVHAEKASVIARLSAGLASEVNDPLTGILGAVQLLAARFKQDPLHREEQRLLANAIEAAQRIRELIKRVQALGQRQPQSQLRPVVVQDLLDSTTGLVGPAMASARVELRRSSDNQVPPILGNFTQLEQALLQVLSNAIGACIAANQPDATLDSNAPAEVSPDLGRQIVVHTRHQDGMVWIRVTDNGIGVPPDALEAIFEPFVTLRLSSGTGLGLTIARRIIEEHGGTIWAESNEGDGTTVNVKLPSVQNVVEQSTGKAALA